MGEIICSIILVLLWAYFWVKAEIESEKYKSGSSNKKKHSYNSRYELGKDLWAPTFSLTNDINNSAIESKVADAESEKNNNQIKNKFTPIEGLNFGIIDNSKLGYQWYSLFRYYPVNKFDYGTLSEINESARDYIFDFKNGRNYLFNSEVIGSALINTFGAALIGKTIAVVPASDKERTNLRYFEFCNKLSEITNINNGFHIISNTDKVKEKVHMGGNRESDLSEYYYLTSSVKGMDFIVLDDIRTTGRHSDFIFNLLNENGAKSVVFVFFGRNADWSVVESTDTINVHVSKLDSWLIESLDNNKSPENVQTIDDLI